MPPLMPPRLFCRLALGWVLLLAGCAGDGGDWPRLLPTDALLTEPAPAVMAETATAVPLVAQANILRARADAMRRQPVIEPETAARMRAATTP